MTAAKKAAAKAPAQVTVTVSEGWVVHDGETQRGQGEKFKADPETAEVWQSQGWVTVS